MRYLVKIETGGQAVATAYTERIKGCVALATDTVFRDCRTIHILTKDPGQFVKAFYADGFTEELTVTCVGS